jgi:3-hydroxyisobutyrate dehydrogenase
MSKIAFIGVGVMGYPMAGHLSAAGHEVTVFNRTTATAKRWLTQYSGQSAQSPRQAADGAEFVLSCVGNDDDLREVALGEHGALAGMQRGSIYIDHTTTSATVARELGEQATDFGVEIIDAPVSGGQAGAENGVLTVMCGGTEQAFERAQPVISAYARTCKLMGAVGSGQLTKMVNQICIGGVLQGLAEGLHFGQLAGLDMDLVLEVISQGAAQSWQMENRGQTMCEGRYDFGFAVDWMRKDLNIISDQATQIGVDLRNTREIDSAYARVQAMGGNRWDTSSLIEVMRRDENQ